ncbi:ferredoxin reductase [Actinomadura alba]|uniref:Ferredoxin reductase n=2 Tax=Actinomadura alba TaxID=406431 RepID=A0ABR7LNK5_9ACTN|nr:ferredoxin reductase [Actinomadura alba]
MRRLAGAARWLTTPLFPDDYLSLVNPLWSEAELCGRIEAVRPETADAVTVVIRPGVGWKPHRAGQWVGIGVDIAGVRHWRTYSLSSPPGRPDGRVTITVKTVPNGLVSRHLARRTTPGTVVALTGPAGEFVLPEPPPARLLFLTAGSGITPVRAMLYDLLTGPRAHQGTAGRKNIRHSPAHGTEHPGSPDVVLVHSAPTPEQMIFGAELRHLAARFPNLSLHQRHTRIEGRLRPADLTAICPDWAERPAWVCGPRGLLQEAAEHWPADRLHIEHFRAAAQMRVGEGGRVRFTRSGRQIDADENTSLLAAGEDAGVLMPSGCRMGICHGCVVPLVSGRVRDLRSGQAHGEPGDLIQTCVSAAAGPVEIEL